MIVYYYYCCAFVRARNMYGSTVLASEEGNSLPEGTATAAQQSRLSQGDRQQKGSCCFRFTSPGLWLGIAWHKRRGSRLSLWRPQKLSQMFVRSGEIPSPGQTSSDKNNDCAMKSERGTPIKGSDPPSGNFGTSRLHCHRSENIAFLLS